MNIASAKSSKGEKEGKNPADIATLLVKEAAQITQGKPEKAEAKSELDVITITPATSEPESVTSEAGKGYSLLVIGVEKMTIRGSGFRGNVTRLAAGFAGPIVIVEARSGLLEQPLDSQRSILVPVNGTLPSRRAAEVAITMARATRAPVSALYVAPPGPSDGKRRPRRLSDAILKDIVALADSYGVDMRTAVRAQGGADEAIVKEAAKRCHNLIVLGVERRPGEKLFFGETAMAVLEKSDRSIMFLAT